MSDDALERLRKRQRPTVQRRDSEAISSEPPKLAATNTPSNQDTQEARSPSSEVEETFQTKASTLRLEANLARELALYCKQEGVSREVLVEAMFAYLQQNQDAQQVILEDAWVRAAKRSEISNRRRAETMMRRFGEG